MADTWRDCRSKLKQRRCISIRRRDDEVNNVLKPNLGKENSYRRKYLYLFKSNCYLFDKINLLIVNIIILEFIDG